MSRVLKFFLVSVLLSGNLLAVTLHAATLSGVVSAQQTSLSVEQTQRLAAWRKFIVAHRHAPVPSLLQSVNQYLNQYPYVKDSSVQGAIERWATPYEFILNNGGDCEDFAIAKYFLLSALGIPEEELQITYVYHRQRLQYHMVLVYSPEHAKRALVLDNLSEAVLSMADRPDLVPIYGFNQHYLWVINDRAGRAQAGSATRLSRWRELMARFSAVSSPL